MRTTLMALGVVLLASTALTADRNKLPVQFAGIGASIVPEMMIKGDRHIGWVDA